MNTGLSYQEEKDFEKMQLEDQEKIIRGGNKLIALFIGAKYIHKYGFADQMGYEFGIKPYAKEQSIRTWHREDSLEFHSSWDWQVPAWSKIAHMCQQLASMPNENAIDRQGEYLKFVERYESAVFTNNPEAGQKVIIDAIKWHNSNQSNQREVK